MNEPPTLYCINHPNTQTALRCNRCEVPICLKCAVKIPTGYRCKNCVQGQQKAFDSSRWFDIPIAFMIAAGLAFLGSLFIPKILLVSIIGSPIAGAMIGETVRLSVQRRRSRKLFRTTVIAIILGCLPTIITELIHFISLVISRGLGGITTLIPLVSQGIYLVLATYIAYYRLSGIAIQLR